MFHKKSTPKYFVVLNTKTQGKLESYFCILKMMFYIERLQETFWISRVLVWLQSVVKYSAVCIKEWPNVGTRWKSPRHGFMKGILNAGNRIKKNRNTKKYPMKKSEPNHLKQLWFFSLVSKKKRQTIMIWNNSWPLIPKEFCWIQKNPAKKTIGPIFVLKNDPFGLLNIERLLWAIVQNFCSIERLHLDILDPKGVGRTPRRWENPKKNTGSF